MKVKNLSPRPTGLQPVTFLVRHAWKLGFVVLALVALCSRGVTDTGPATLQLHQHPLAVASSGPTLISCGAQQSQTWSAAGSPYILPATDPTTCPAFPAPNQVATTQPPYGVYFPVGTTLTLDASSGPVQIFSHGAGIYLQGGQIQTFGAGPSINDPTQINTISFDAEPDVASWDGIWISTGTQGTQTVAGTAQFDYTSVAHALTAVQIDSGATSLQGYSTAVNGGTGGYGLVFTNGAIGPSYFDGVDAINTPVQLIGQADGKYGTVNNIGSQGVKATFDAAHSPTRPLDIEGMYFGSSVPFAETGCLPLQPCAAGLIGNDAIQANLAGQGGIILHGNHLLRAGSYGAELNGADYPVITNNDFVCNGSASPTPISSCVAPAGSNLLKYSAIYVNDWPAQAHLDFSSDIVGNTGEENGIDALVMNGIVTSGLVWKTPVTDGTAGDANPLGYMVANGDLSFVNGGQLTVNRGDVVKVGAGAIDFMNGSLLVTGDDTHPRAVFTSIRDTTTSAPDGCGSVFAQNCPTPPASLPANEWTGIKVAGAGSGASIDHAIIRYASTGVDVENGPAAGISVTNSLVGPSLGDGVRDLSTPITLKSDVFTQNAGHGVLAISPGAAGTVDLEKNVIDHAGLSGIELRDSVTPTLVQNDVTNSGVVSSSAGGPAANSSAEPAIWLNGVTNAQLATACPVTVAKFICENGGGSNGLDTLALHGSANGGLDWIAPKANTPGAYTGSLGWVSQPVFGYLLDNSLAVKGGDFTVSNTQSYVPIMQGSISITGGKLSAVGATFTSFRETGRPLTACGSIFLPGTTCSSAAAGDWGGLSLDPGYANSVTGGSVIQYSTAGVLVVAPSGTPTSAVTLQFENSSIQHVTGDAIQTTTALEVRQGSFLDIGGNGINQDAGSLPRQSAIATLSVTSPGAHTVFSGIGKAGIVSKGMDRLKAQVSDTTIASAGTYGIDLESADDQGSQNLLTVTNNDVRGSGTATSQSPETYPAIYINGFSGTAAHIAGNTGSHNGLNALAFHGTVMDSLSWITASPVGGPLGYLVDGNLTVGGDLTVYSGAVVKLMGTLSLSTTLDTVPAAAVGGGLHADDVRTPNLKVFTSLTDDSIGLQACQSVLLVCAAGSPQVGDWGGIALGANAASVCSSQGSDVVNASVRYAATAIKVNSGASCSAQSPTFGLTVTRSSVGPSLTDGINAFGTPISVTDSSIGNLGAPSPALHGIVVDYAGGTAPLFLTGNRFANTAAEAIVGQHLTGHSLWITGNHVSGAGTFGMRLPSADQLILRNNDVSASGTSTGLNYPAIYLAGLSGDFLHNIRGNTGSGNGLDAIAFDGAVTGDLPWLSPDKTSSLGYVLDGSLTVQNGNLIVSRGSYVRVLTGSITINRGTLQAGTNAGTTSEVFTSFRDASSPDAGPQICPSVFNPTCVAGTAAAGDWGGIAINGISVSNPQAQSTLNNAYVRYAMTGISVNAGPFVAGDPAASANYRFQMTGGAVTNTSGDGIDAIDTPISVTGATIGVLGSPGNIAGNGISASFLSPANCLTPPAQCLRMQLTGNFIYATGKDGIVANGLAGQPAQVVNNTVTGAAGYGIRLLGANQLTLTDNTVSSSGGVTYPAIYLPDVIGDFNTAITRNHGGFNGINAIAFHGIANNGLTWTSASTQFGYLADGDLTVNGPLTLTGAFDATGTNLVFKMLNGKLTVNGVLNATDTTFTSVRDNTGFTSCPSVFSQSCAIGPADWGGLVIKGGPSSVAGAIVSHAATGITGDGGVSISCASVQQNATGLSLTAGDSVTQSDILNNSVNQMVAPAGVNADSDWWGSTTPPLTGTAAADATHPLKSQRPSLDPAAGGSIQPTDTNTNASTQYFGVGTLNVSLNFSRQMDTAAAAAPVMTSSQVNFNASPVVAGSFTKQWSPDGKSWSVSNFQLASGDVTSLQPTPTVLNISGATSCVRDPSTNGMAAAPSSPSFTTDLRAPIAPTGLTTLTAGIASQVVQGTINPSGWATTAVFEWFDGSVVHASLPITVGTSSSPVDVQTTLATPGLTAGTPYAFQLLAIDGNDSAGVLANSAGSFTPTGAVAGFKITASASSVTAGTGVTETIAATDGTHTVADYTGTLALSGDPHAKYRVGTSGPLNPLATPLNFPLSAAGSIALTVYYNATPSVTLSATDGSLNTLSSDTIAITAATLDHFDFSGLASSTAGVPQSSVVVSARDSTDTLIPGYSGTVAFTSTDLKATLPGETTFAAADGGQKTVSITLKTAGAQSVTASDIGIYPAVQSSKSGLMVTAANTSGFAFASLPGSATAGTPTASITATAVDAFGNNSSYNSTVHFSSSDSQAVLPADTAVLNSTTFNVTFKTSGSQTITVADKTDSTITSTSTPVPVSAASPSTLVFSGLPASSTAGSPALPFVLTAKDAYGNPSSYNGTVTFTSTDGQAVKPSSSAFSGSTSISRSVTFKTAGAQTITATDTISPSITATSPSVGVMPAATSKLVFSGLPTAATAGSPVGFTLTAQDPYGNLTSGYTGMVHFSSTDPHAVLPFDTTLSGGYVTTQATLETTPSQTVTATDTLAPAITGTSAGVTINPSTASQLAFTSAPTSTQAGTPSTAITIQQQDAYGNPVNVTATSGLAIGLTTTNPLTGSFLKTDGTPLTTPAISMGSSTLTFKYKDTKASSPTLSAGASGLTTATQTETVSAGPATKLVFTTTAQSFNAGVPSAVMIVQQQDQYGNPVAAGAPETITLSSSNGTTGTFLKTDGKSPLGTATIATGASFLAFTYEDGALGGVTITAHYAPIPTDATQNETIQ